MSYAWVLNLDADLELARAGYSPTRAVRASMRPHVERLAGTLLGPGDVLVDETCEPGCASGLVGRAFCPTARALVLLERAGATPERHPSQAILREVNGRAFCASLGQTMPEAAFVETLEAALAKLEHPPVLAAQWRVKRAFGMAGRGQRVVRPGIVSASDQAFLRTSVAEQGGVMIEPNVTIVRELGMHAMLAETGDLRVGQLVEQRCDAFGQWLETMVSDDAAHAPWDALTAEVRHVATALHGAGYFGPFGIDAFVYRDAAGAEHLQPRSEINARYSMGFAVGMRMDPRQP